MIFPRVTALQAGASVEKALTPIVGRISRCGDLRMERSTLSRIEYVIERADPDAVVQAMAGAGWRRLRAGHGPMVYAKDGFPKAVICISHHERSDLLGVTHPSNFEVLLFLRTGTHLFIRGVLGYIRQNGFIVRPERGLFHGDTLVAWTEADIFLSAGIEYVPPTERYLFRPENYMVAVDF
jgi:DNA polymerase/3'-5' exonuclease PolX